jgi:hypothetical protein
VARATSEATRATRLQQYATAHHACEQAIARYDHLAVLRHFLRDALHRCSPQGRLRTHANVRSELPLLFDMIDEVDGTAMSKLLKPIRTHLDDMLVPFQQAEAIDAALRAVVPDEALAFLVLAWHHDHLSSQARAKTTCDHQHERACWLACAAGLLDDTCDRLKALVCDQLDSIRRASSLVEMVHGLLRPSLKSCQGQLTQETFNLLMFSHNHRRDKSGKRKGKAPMARLTGEPFEAPWWELLRHQITIAPGMTAPATVPSSPLLHLVPNHEAGADQAAMASDHVIVDPAGASQTDGRPKKSKAASSFQLC